ncbi:maleylacetoacetate isomerase [Chromohalobacter nigrandesensis]|uniref:maleylacetoacetate isomerase n=1 Tax=Chromohalobacter nigrandesensis TaxID=119863 RepID=UPI001FF278C3|nr:maleylacetoacetate isomerase [Chromohalobacter nigrandesensis]MCK0745228.1 maleylacetoacetate isomerase [Chromohalobacter nigrandesensis]
MSLVLHNFFRSSASVRVRAALHLKGLTYTHVSYTLRQGEHRSPAYLSLNPQGLVPALQLDDGTVVAQSLAIIEYLDEVHPKPLLLPSDPLDRAWVRGLAHSIASDIHPLNNLRVLQYLGQELDVSEAGVTTWFRHWVAESFASLERQLADDPRRGQFCYGDSPGLADICLFAQMANNRRFRVDMTPYPTLATINTNCLALPAFVDALPESHPHVG